MAEIVLTFSDLWQEAVVGHMMSDYQFYLNCKNYLKPGWFEQPELRELVRVMNALHDSLPVKRQVSAAEIDGKLAQEYLNKQEHNKYRQFLIKCQMSAKMVGVDVLSQDLTTWVRIIKLHDLLAAGEKLFNSKQYMQAGEKIREAVRDMMSTEFAPPMEASFKDPITFLRQRDAELQDCVTTGHYDFDNHLRTGALRPVPPGATAEYLRDLKNRTFGALAKGDSTLLVGPTNAGKTTTCVTIVANNVKIGKDVMYITMEQKERDIKTKLLQAYLSVTGEQLSMTVKEDELVANNKQDTLKLLVAANQLDKHLTYISYTNPTSMYVEDVLDLIEKMQEKRVAATGKGYDLLIVDYPGMLSSRAYAMKKSSGWEEIAYVYKQMYMTARHHNFHGIYPMQTNREGYRINKGDANKFVDSSDVAQGFNAVHGADNVITLNRTPQDEATNMMHFYVAKARLGKKGWTFTTKTDFARSITHGFHLECKITDGADRGLAASAADTILQAGKVDRGEGTMEFHVRHLKPVNSEPVNDVPVDPEPSDPQGGVVS